MPGRGTAVPYDRGRRVKPGDDEVDLLLTSINEREWRTNNVASDHKIGSSQGRTSMYKKIGPIATAMVLAMSTAALAHSLRIECKKITSEDVVCRAVTSDGELARDIEVQLLATGDYRVLATGKTDAAGMYAFKVPAVGYHIVATGDKAHVTSMSSVDVW
jgi:hypothetical protein